MTTRPAANGAEQLRSPLLTDTRVDRQTYTLEEAAQLLGISRATAYECVRDGSLPALRLRRRVVVSRAAIEALLTTTPPPSTR